jgi:hypothetical protein
VKQEVLYLALNETTHALRFAESAAKRFETDVDELETGSKVAGSVAFIKNQLSDARESLFTAQGEIGRLIHGSQHGVVGTTSPARTWPVGPDSSHEKPGENQTWLLSFTGR